MLTNPGFDDSAGWTLSSATRATDVDVDSCMGSGSAHVTGSLGSQAIQCLAIPAGVVGTGRDLYFGFRFKPDNDFGGTAICNLSFWANSSCTGDMFGSGTADVRYSENSENNWVQAGSNAIAKQGATHYYLNCVAAASSGYYDQLYLSTTSPGVPAF